MGIPRHMSHMELSLIDKIFRCQGISILFCKLIQCQFTHCKIIRSPIREQRTSLFVRPPDPHKIIKQRRKTDYRSIGMFLTPAFKPPLQIFTDRGISGVDLHQMLLIPVICSMVIHGDLFPDPVCKKAHRIFMPGNHILYRYRFLLFIISPILRRNQ